MATHTTPRTLGTLIANYRGILRRRRVVCAVTFGAIVLAALVMAWTWPASYQATGTILIEQQELPTDLVRSTITSYADQRIQVISQRVMTTDNLLEIIQRYDLYPRVRRTKSREVVIGMMRKDVQFRMISADVVDPRQGRATKATIAFSVSYSGVSPELAAKVANELVSLYLKENLESRKQSSDDAASFLAEESKRLSDEIAASQAKLADFKQLHGNELPELNVLNMQMLSHTQEAMRDTDAELRSLDQQIVMLDAQLAQINPTAQVYASTGERVQSPSDRLKYLRSEYARLSAVYASDHPDVLRTKREIDGLQASVGAGSDVSDLRRQLEAATTALESARQHYSPDHPDVLQLERVTAALQKQIADARNAGVAGAGSSAAATAEAGADNPAWIQIHAQREAASNQRASLQRKRGEEAHVLGDYQVRLGKMPDVERDYTALSRELDSAQIKYREIRQKQMEAELAQNLESERKGERFTLIEPPLAPQEPISPNRSLILIMGLVGGLGAAFGLALLLEALDETIRGRTELRQQFGVAPLAIIPWMQSDLDLQQRRQRQRFALAGTAAGLVAAVVAVHFLYRPLDVLWVVVMRRLGIEV